ncbi:hypothetical protein J6590_083166 [Homalodisca vitripennis]|nr:hypothetical protein J6590_083166 [Homalodisca vitripennis]
MVVVTTFASNLASLETLIHAGQMAKRKVVLSGRSLHRILLAAQESVYMKDFAPLIDERDIARFKRQELLVIATGCQEVLNKIAENRTLYVLAASSTVSVGWRGSFNKNWMWCPQCNADSAEYLETADCRVDPRFDSQELDDGTLTCLYKKVGNKRITIKESLLMG